MRLAFYRDKSVLLVDDELDILKTYSNLLRDEGIKDVITANNGADAVILASEHDPDVTLLDLNMNPMSGWEVIEAFKSKNINTRIIIFTVDDEPDTIFRAAKSGVTDYLPKSRFPDEGLTRIKRAMLVGEVTKNTPGFGILLSKLSDIRQIALREAKGDSELTEAIDALISDIQTGNVDAKSWDTGVKKIKDKGRKLGLNSIADIVQILSDIGGLLVG